MTVGTDRNLDENFVAVGPHAFEPLSRFRNKGRCRACFATEDSHPMLGWTNARALGDRRLPSLRIRYTPKPVTEEVL